MKFVIALALSFACTSAMAADSCQSKAVDKNNKKLGGAALTSFMTKCKTDATIVCAQQAVDKKLSGAAKNSFTKKCYDDAIGAS